MRLDSRASTFHTEKRLVKLRVETRATFATIFVATQVTRQHAVNTRSLIVLVTLNARTWMLTTIGISMQVVSLSNEDYIVRSGTALGDFLCS